MTVNHNSAIFQIAQFHGEVADETTVIPPNIIAANLGIITALLIGVPMLLTFAVSFFKKRVTRRAEIFLYAISAGLIIMVGTVGLFGHAREEFGEFFNSIRDFTNDHPGQTVITQVDLIFIVAGVVVGAFIIAVGFFFGVRSLVLKKTCATQDPCHGLSHSHCVVNFSDKKNPKEKWTALIAIFAHRFVDGLAVGLITANTSTLQIGQLDWGFVVTFTLHVLPVTIVVYFGQLQISQNKWKAIGYTFLFVLIPIPFVFIGGFVNINQDAPLLLAFLFTLTGGLITIMTIIELIPEFTDIHKMSRHDWSIAIGLLILGIVIAAVLIFIVFHPEG